MTTLTSTWTSAITLHLHEIGEDEIALKIVVNDVQLGCIVSAADLKAALNTGNKTIQLPPATDLPEDWQSTGHQTGQGRR